MRASRIGIGVLLAVALLGAASGGAAGQGRASGGTAPCQVHVVLFVAAGLQPPAGYAQRIDAIVAAAETFFRRELGRWGHADAVMPFRRSPDGHVEVTLFRGREPLARYQPVPIRAEVMDALRRENRIDGGRQIWWILVYPGEPPARFDHFLGGCGPGIGGWAVGNLDMTPGRIDPAAPLGADFPAKLMLKGLIHELGHGFDVPHLGPLARDNAGNTLMGPTHKNFERVARYHEPRVSLSEAEAALFATHPAFRGTVDDRRPVPRADVQELRYAADPQSRTLTVTGRAQAARRVAYVLVADEADARPGEYWTKAYVGKVGPDGAFRVVVTEPWESAGTLRTGLVFENGAVTVHPSGTGRDGGILQAYRYGQRQWSFP